MFPIRHARAGDEAAILRCLAAAFEPFRTLYTPEAFAATVLDADGLGERMARMDVFVADAGDEGVVGTVAAGVAGDDGLVRGMAVLPVWHRHGIARRLLRRALDELTIAGCRRATLGTTAPLVRASRLYEAASFARTGRTPDFFGMPLHEYVRPLDAGITVREAGVDDEAAILRIVNTAYLVERHFVHGDRVSAAELREHFDRGTFLVADRGRGPIACVFLQRTGANRVYLGLLAVDPEEQRQGLGRLMMAAAERRGRTGGIREIDIRIVNLRTELPPFYRGRGFIPRGTEPFHDPRLFRPAHFLTMTLTL